jgi:hypothetical protein
MCFLTLNLQTGLHAITVHFKDIAYSYIITFNSVVQYLFMVNLMRDE